MWPRNSPGCGRPRDHLRRGVTRLVEREGDRLASLRSRPVLLSPDVMVTPRHDDVERLKGRSQAAVTTAVVRAADQLVHLKAQVRALSPQKTLDRGYAVVQLAGQRPAPGARRDVVRHPEQAPAGHRPDRPGGRWPVHRGVDRRPGTGRRMTQTARHADHHRYIHRTGTQQGAARHGSRTKAQRRHRGPELRGGPRAAGRRRQQAGGRRGQPGGVTRALGTRRGAGQALRTVARRAPASGWPRPGSSAAQES